MFLSNQRSNFGSLGLALVVILVGSTTALAQIYVAPQSVLNPAPTFESKVLTDPSDVPGKEYSNNLDKTAAGIPNTGQIVHWDGGGTSVWDSFDYYLSDGVGGETHLQVDALANIRDMYFLDLDGTRDAVYKDGDTTPYHDTVSLLVSFQKDGVDEEYEKNIYASRSAYLDGSTQVWAKWDENINATPGALDDIDGLELYGPDQSDDANMYSRQSDPIPEGETQRYSVFRFHPNGASGDSTPYLATQVLLDAVIDDNGNHPDWDVANDPNDFDLDAMMIWDVAGDDVFGPGDKILFSVCPIDELFDGGEIWQYEFGDLAAAFLVHGELDDGETARVWNTAHNVSQHFFGDSLHSENINAMEAIPEPTALVLLLVGGMMAGACMRRRAT